MCARLKRLLNKKNMYTVKCIGSRAIGYVPTMIFFAPIVLTIYLHVLSRAVVDRDLT